MFTKGKWEAKPSTDESWVIMSGNIVIARFSRKDKPECNEANAKRICTCVNSYDGLVEACKAAKNFIETGQINPDHKPSPETEANMALLGTEKNAMLAGLEQVLKNAEKP